jgi:hypothetical protein
VIVVHGSVALLFAGILLMLGSGVGTAGMDGGIITRQFDDQFHVLFERLVQMGLGLFLRIRPFFFRRRQKAEENLRVNQGKK